MCSTHARGFRFSDDLYQIASPEGGARLLFAEVDFGYGDLTAVYGRDGKNCAVSPTATTSWSNTASPTDWCPATNTTVTTPTVKCSKAATANATTTAALP